MVSAPGGGVSRRRRPGPLHDALGPYQAQADGAPGPVTGLTGSADGRSVIDIELDCAKQRHGDGLPD